MGKTNAVRWGLLGLGCAAALWACLHNPVKIAERPAPPAPTPTPGPLAGAVICLDPGHGGYDGVAYGRDSGTPEKELNLDVALRLRDALSFRERKLQRKRAGEPGWRGDDGCFRQLIE